VKELYCTVEWSTYDKTYDYIRHQQYRLQRVRNMRTQKTQYSCTSAIAHSLHCIQHYSIEYSKSSNTAKQVYNNLPAV